MNARNRRSARRKAIHVQFPLGAIVKFVSVGDGAWEVFGYRGQTLMLGRPGHRAQYPAHAWELRRCHTEFLALKPEAWRPTAF
jgi:hypothetical protein